MWNEAGFKAVEQDKILHPTWPSCLTFSAAVQFGSNEISERGKGRHMADVGCDEMKIRQIILERCRKSTRTFWSWFVGPMVVTFLLNMILPDHVLTSIFLMVLMFGCIFYGTIKSIKWLKCPSCGKTLLGIIQTPAFRLSESVHFCACCGVDLEKEMALTDEDR